MIDERNMLRGGGEGNGVEFPEDDAAQPDLFKKNV
jgi:hypothetical protein